MLLLPLLACAGGAARPAVLAELEVAPDEEEAEFRSAGEPFTSASRCTEHLAELVALFPAEGYEIARGPYPVLENDIRVHAIGAREGDYVVVEYRCLGPAMEARSWSAGPSGSDPEPFTLEDVLTTTFPPGEEK